MHLEKAIFINRAPFEHLELEFRDNGINVLSAVNGKGKTTILSHIVDAFHEMARNTFSNSYEGIENKYYRVSSTIYNLNGAKTSCVYLRFKDGENEYDYIDIVGHCTEEQYNSTININNKIQYNELKSDLENRDSIKYCSSTFDNTKKKAVFNNNVLTYFPAYRYEQPGYLNDPYKVNLKFKLHSDFRDQLPNPIEVVSDLNNCTNWLMDIVLDLELYKKDGIIFSNINNVISLALFSKNTNIRIGVGSRTNGNARLALVDTQTNNIVYPSIFNLSSGELSVICIFCELLRQADKLNKMSDISGIVLIDEIDKHLHIKLQKEVLPKLFALFPNIQFIVSSHSPFLNMGLADSLSNNSQIIDLDNNGITCSPTNNNLYLEVYEMMIEENHRFAKKYSELKIQIKSSNNPLIITEGKTDVKHIKRAQEKLNRTDIDVDYYEIKEDWGDSRLEILLNNLSKIKQNRKIIGIFDRDNEAILKSIEDDNAYKAFGNSNVYAFAIPLKNANLYGEKISIEHYYKKENLLKTDKDGRRLFLGEEFYDSGNSINGEYQTKIKQIKNKVDINGVIDNKVYKKDDLEQTKSIALSKDDFASLIESDDDYINDFDFSNFDDIFNTIETILSL